MKGIIDSAEKYKNGRKENIKKLWFEMLTKNFEMLTKNFKSARSSNSRIVFQICSMLWCVTRMHTICTHMN